MDILAYVEDFEWDAGNARKSVDKHGISREEAEEAFENEPLLLAEDPRHSAAEPRFHALGRTNQGLALQIAFTLRSEGRSIRVISVRRMNRKERILYERNA